MKRPSSAQVGFAKQFLARYPWRRLEPKPDTVAWADNQPARDDVGHALGIGTELRIVYVPRAVRSARSSLSGAWSTPPACSIRLLAIVHLWVKFAPTRLVLRCPAPNHKHDWVFVLERPTR